MDLVGCRSQPAMDLIASWEILISSFAAYSIVLSTVTLGAFGCHIWSASLSLRVRNLNIADYAAWKKIYDHAAKGAKVGLSMEVAIVCSVCNAQYNPSPSG
jgi:hypothetical protein